MDTLINKLGLEIPLALKQPDDDRRVEQHDGHRQVERNSSVIRPETLLMAGVHLLDGFDLLSRAGVQALAQEADYGCRLLIVGVLLVGRDLAMRV